MKAIFFRDFDSSFIGHICRETFQDRVYDPFLSQDMTIIDAGSNVGVSVLYLSRFAKFLLAIEPCDDHHELLCETVEFNRLKNVGVAKVALGAKDEDRFLSVNAGNTTMNRFSANPTEHKVRAMSIGSLLAAYKIDTVDFLKMDIEGAEYEVLASDSFRECAPRIKSVFVDCHDGAGRVHLLLNERGFRTWDIPSQHSILVGGRIK